jgi:O-antigen ligase
VVPIYLGLYLSFSRGALAATAVGLVALILVVPSRTQVRALTLVLVGGGLCALVSSFLPGVESLAGSAADRRVDGLVMLGALALAAAATAAVARALVQAGDRENIRLALPRRALLAGLAVLVLAGPPAAALAKDRSELPSRLPKVGARRLGDVGSNRYAYWRVALDTFAHHPLAGVGPSGFDVEWARERRIREEVHDAHSLYLETLAELGLVGAVFLALFLGGVTAAAVTVASRDPAMAGGLVSALAVWGAHVALDWDWEMPGVTLVALVIAGALLARASEPARG